MRRVAVVGSSGAGKSTFARELGEILGVPVIHLDSHFWQPGWVATPPDRWRERQRSLVAGDRWIADGNFSSTLDLRLGRADTVVVLALPRWLCLLRVVRRWFAHRGRAIHAAGCPERLTPEFIRWVWNYPRAGRARLDDAIARYGQAATVVELSSVAAVTRFLGDVRARAIPAQGQAGLSDDG